MGPETTSFRMDASPGPLSDGIDSVMLGDFMLPSVKANGGINICTWRPWSDIVDYEHMHFVNK